MRILAVAPVLAALAFAGGGKGHGHPHFNDGGTLEWHEDLDAAQGAAKDQSKLVFIEYGRAG